MESETPGQGAGPDQPDASGATPPEPAWTTPPPAAPAPASGSWNAAPPQPEPAAPAQPAPQWGQPAAQGQWGGAPQQPAPVPQPAPQWGAQSGQGQWGQPAAPAPQQPVAQQGWGQQPSAPTPAPQQPAQPGWGQPAPAPAPQQGWGQQPPAQQPAAQPQPGWNAAPQQPAPQQSWGQQPPAQQQPAPQGQWAAPVAGAVYGGPPPQGAAPQPGWGQPGQPQPGWAGGAPPPAQTGMNGCLKACLIVGAIGIVLAIVAFIALGALVKSAADGIGIDPNGGGLKDCSIVSSQQLKTVLGQDTEAHPLSGIANAAVGATLDKRVLPDADNCYILSGAGTAASADQVSGGFGRIAKYSGDASGTFQKELDKAKAGNYFAVDVSGAGDQAFCTGWSDTYPATGALVRKGGDLVYVSLLIGTNFTGLDLASSESGVPYSQDACDQAVQIAKLALH